MTITLNNGTSKEDKLFSWDDLLNISIGGLFSLAELTATTAFPAAITAIVMQKILKKIDANVTDALYEKQLNDYWKANREVTYKKILRQTELFSINSSLEKIDVASYMQQWIKENPMYAKQFPSMIETAISYSQQMLADAKGSDVIDFYKRQVLSLIDWKEKYDSVYSTIPKSAIQPINFNAVDTKIKIPQKIDIEKTNVIHKIEKPSTGVGSIFGTISENTESQGYSGSGFSLGDIAKMNLEIESEFTLGKNELGPSLEDIAAKAEEISSKKLPVEEMSKFNDNLLTASFYGQQIGAAFMNVDENIGKAISSTATLTGGVAGIFKAFEGAETDGLALMGGIQGAFAGLQGLLGSEVDLARFQILTIKKN